MKTIKQMIIALASTFEETTQQINNGLCGEFAYLLENAGYGEAVWGGELCPVRWSTKAVFTKDWFSHFADCHCFIRYNDRYYDSECSGGVDFPDDLPIYQRQYNYHRIQEIKWGEEKCR